MENMDKKDCGCAEGKCMCGGMGHMHGCHGRHHLVKVILKIFIIILIFWCGFTLGQQVGFIKANYSHSMMRQDADWRMMDGGWGNNSNAQVVPSTTVPTTLPAPVK